MREEVLRVEALNKTIGNERILCNISFQLFKGETLALLGANGAGKTSLINSLGALTPIDSGQIYYRERQVTLRNPFDAKVLGIYIAGNKRQILDNLTVAENITLGREDSFFLRKRRQNALAEKYLRDIGVDNIAPSQLAGSLSPSQKALVQLAAVYASHPSVLIIDEPSFFNSDMDQSMLWNAIRNLNKRDIAVIYITHSIDDALHIAGRILLLRNGVAAGCFERQACTREFLVSAMAGRQSPEIHRRPAPTGGILLSVEHLAGNTVKDVSFSVSRGEILGITGITGSGKTEILELISGIRQKTAGTISLLGKEVAIRTPASAVAQGICYAPEDIAAMGPIPHLTVGENIVLPALQRISTLGWIHAKAEKVFARTLLALLGQGELAQSTATSTLSGGLLQKVLIARCLSANPMILLLDEPTKSIDLLNRKMLLRGISEAARRGLTVIIASSDVSELMQLCDKLIVIRKGILKGELSVSGQSLSNILTILYGSEGEQR